MQGHFKDTLVYQGSDISHKLSHIHFTLNMGKSYTVVDVEVTDEDGRD